MVTLFKFIEVNYKGKKDERRIEAPKLKFLKKVFYSKKTKAMAN